MSADPIKMHFKFQITKNNVMLALLANDNAVLFHIKMKLIIIIVTKIIYNQGQGPSCGMRLGLEDKWWHVRSED